MKDVVFSELIDTHVLQMLQDSFSVYTGLTMCVVDSEGVPVIRVSGRTDFCDAYVKNTEKGISCCNECLKNAIIKARETGMAVTYNCHMGLANSVVPIIFQDRILGNIVVYSVRSEDSKEEKVIEYVTESGGSVDECIEEFRKINYVPRADIEKNTMFLFEFAKALSVMAYDNYAKLVESRKTERIAKSQADFITGLTEELHESTKEWLDSLGAATGKFMDVPEIAEVTKGLLSKGQEIYSVIGGAVDYIRLVGGKNEYSENYYNVRQLIDNAVLTLEGQARASGVEMKTDYDSSVPETLIGNSGRVGELLNKMVNNVIKFTNSGGKIEIAVSCDKTRYSCILNIRIINEGCNVTANMAEDVRQYVRSGDYSVLGGNDNLRDIDFRLILLLTHQMFGKVVLENLEDGRLTLLISFPQLDGAKRTYREELV